MNGFSIRLPDILSATNCVGQKSDGSDEDGNPGQSSNLNPLGRYSRRPQL